MSKINMAVQTKLVKLNVQTCRTML